MNAAPAMTAFASSAAGPRRVPEILLEGIRVAVIDERATVRAVIDALEEGRGGRLVTCNLDILRQARNDRSIRDLIESADLRVADGMPLLWAARVQGTPLPERVCGSNLIHSLPAAAAAAGRSIYLLGGDPGTADSAAAALVKASPALRIVGTHCPPFGFESNAEEMRRIESRIESSGADIVLVALGFPKQERLIERLRPRRPDAWWIGVGISFSFAAGAVRRAPRWMQALGLEWVHRTLQEPRRLFKRYVVHDIPYGLALLWRSWRRRGRAEATRYTPPHA